MIGKPRVELNEDTKPRPYSFINTFDNTKEILLGLGLKEVGEDGKGIFMQVKDDKRKNSIHVYYDSGRFFCFSKEFEPFEQDEDYDTVELIEGGLGVNAMEWGNNKGLIDDISYASYAKKQHSKPKEFAPIIDAQQNLNSIIDRPDKVPIFDTWLYPNSISWLFAPGGVGKTFFAIEVCSSIASGKIFEPFPAPTITGEILYLNFEMDWDDMKMRRLDTKSREYYELPKGFKMLCKEELTEVNSAKEIITLVKFYLAMYPFIKVVVIDNITWVSNNLSDVKDAITLVKDLDRAIKGAGVALWLIAHTTKVQLNKIMTTSDMAGGAPLANLAPYQNGLRESMVEQGVLLFKSFQHRASKKKYVLELPKFHLETDHDKAPVKLTFRGEYDKESKHIIGLGVPKNTKNIERDIKVKLTTDLLALELETETGETVKMTQEQVAEVLNIGVRTVRRYKNASEIKPRKPTEL